MVKLNSGTEQEALVQIEEIYKKFNPDVPFEFRFIDENYQAMYSSERVVTLLSKYFAGLAIIISCLGLFGLALFTTIQRRKEIGIRKVLGQKRSQIVLMLSSEFAKLVLAAMGIAIPIAFLLAKDWLSDFAYRISLSVWYFMGAGLLALVIALVTVGGQAFFAAKQSPVNALRGE